MLLTLINHPTPAFSLEPHNDPNARVVLGNVYRRTMPVSLARVAAALERAIDIRVDLLDLKANDPSRETEYKRVDLGDRMAIVNRIGAGFEAATEAVRRSDIIGMSNHFTYESGIIRDMIAFARSIRPDVRIIVGGADAKARPQFYLDAGADLVFRGDVKPDELIDNDWSQKRIISDYRHPFVEMSQPAFEKLSSVSQYTDSHDGPVPDGVGTPVGFIHFTRGCPRECDFCESRRTKFEALPLDIAMEMIHHYKSFGIRTLNFADDNLLLLKRDYLQSLFGALREHGFAWEFPNGLEIGLFARNGTIDHDLIATLFANHRESDTGRHVGAYRVFIPVETFDRRDNYKKLKSVDIQNDIIDSILQHRLPEVNFGVVLGSDADENTFKSIIDGYNSIKLVVQRYPTVKARYSVFHLIPISLFRSMPTNFSVDEFPEGWNFYFPCYDGKNFTAMELFDRRLATVSVIDPALARGMKTGTYAYA